MSRYCFHKQIPHFPLLHLFPRHTSMYSSLPLLIHCHCLPNRHTHTHTKNNLASHVVKIQNVYFLFIIQVAEFFVLWSLQEMVLLRSQMGGQVNVAVDASPSTDLNQVMSEIREHYEGVIGKNRRELEAWYQNKVRGRNCLEYSHFNRLLRLYQIDSLL